MQRRFRQKKNKSYRVYSLVIKKSSKYFFKLRERFYFLFVKKSCHRLKSPFSANFRLRVYFFFLCIIMLCVCQSWTVRRAGGQAAVTWLEVDAGCGLNKVEWDRCHTRAGRTASPTRARLCIVCCCTRKPGTAGTTLPVLIVTRSSAKWINYKHPHQFSCSRGKAVVFDLWRLEALQYDIVIVSFRCCVTVTRSSV